MIIYSCAEAGSCGVFRHPQPLAQIFIRHFPYCIIIGPLYSGALAPNRNKLVPWATLRLAIPSQGTWTLKEGRKEKTREGGKPRHTPGKPVRVPSSPPVLSHYQGKHAHGPACPSVSPKYWVKSHLFELYELSSASPCLDPRVLPTICTPGSLPDIYSSSSLKAACYLV